MAPLPDTPLQKRAPESPRPRRKLPAQRKDCSRRPESLSYLLTRTPRRPKLGRLYSIWPSAISFCQRQRLGSGERPQGLLGEFQRTQSRAAHRDAPLPPRNRASGCFADQGWGSRRGGDAGDAQGAGAIVDRRGSYHSGEELYSGETEQVQGRIGGLTEAFSQFLGQVVELRGRVNAGGPAVEVYAFDLVPHVIYRQVGVQRQLHYHRGCVLLPPRLALRQRDRLFEKPEVHLETDRRDLPRLLRAEQVAGAPDLEIPHGDGEPAPELREVHQGFEALLGLGRSSQRGEEVGVGLLGGASDPAAQLVELREAHRVGP